MFKNLILAIITISLVSFNAYAGSDGELTLSKEQPEEIKDWFEMCGAEIDVSKLISTMMTDGNLTRDKFVKYMTSLAKTHHRDYDLSGNLGGGHD